MVHDALMRSDQRRRLSAHRLSHRLPASQIIARCTLAISLKGTMNLAPTAAIDDRPIPIRIRRADAASFGQASARMRSAIVRAPAKVNQGSSAWEGVDAAEAPGPDGGQHPPERIAEHLFEAPVPVGVVGAADDLELQAT